jgi:hypothetical protein
MARNLLAGPGWGNGMWRRDLEPGVSTALCAVQYGDAPEGAQSSRKVIEYFPNSSLFMQD